MTGAPCLGQTLNCIGHLDIGYKPGLSHTHHSVWSPGSALDRNPPVPYQWKRLHQVHAFPQMGHDIPVNFPPETSFKIHNIQALSHLSTLPSHHASSHRHHSVCIKALAPGRVSEFLEKNKCILSCRMKHCPPPPPYYHMSTFPARKEARKIKAMPL